MTAILDYIKENVYFFIIKTIFNYFVATIIIIIIMSLACYCFSQCVNKSVKYIMLLLLILLSLLWTIAKMSMYFNDNFRIRLLIDMFLLGVC
jgi:hypothetical protein